MKRLRNLTLLVLFLVCAAYAQDTPFFFPVENLFWSFDDGAGGPAHFCPGCSYPQIDDEYMTPLVGVAAYCGAATGVRSGITIQQYNVCWYENRANVQASYSQEPGAYQMFVSGYDVVLNPDYSPWYTVTNWSYLTNCDIFPQIKIYFVYDYGCPPNTP